MSNEEAQRQAKLRSLAELWTLQIARYYQSQAYPDASVISYLNRQICSLVAGHESELAEAKAESERLRQACINQQHDIQQALGKALGYPTFPPEWNAGDRVSVGEHTAESLAEEASAMLLLRNHELRELQEVLSDCVEHLQRAHYREEPDDRKERERVLAKVQELISHA